MVKHLRKLRIWWRIINTPPKIVALMPARNEGAKLRVTLKALSLYTDAIVYLDDCSTDDSLLHVEACREECRVERILKNEEWKRNEPADRNWLLKVGREIGGTHFIVIDADEILTSNFLPGDYLRKRILALAPGDAIYLRWIHLWRGVDLYRTNGIMGIHQEKKCIFRDNGRGFYNSDFIHTPRVPKMKGKKVKLDLPYGLLHFQCVNWENVCQKQKWYRWLERVERPERSVEEISARYQGNVDETDLQTEACLKEWLEHYPFFDPAPFHLPEKWRLEQMKEWEKTKGVAYFSGLSEV